MSEKSPMDKTTKQIGDEGEQMAVQMLKADGYQIIERNFRTRAGEIDIIAKDGGTLVFVEVKAKKDDFFGTPGEMITKRKLEKIKRTAKTYLSENDKNRDWRIDAILIEGKKSEHLKNITL